MALVTVHRSPSVGSPQCSNSDSEADDDEGSKNEKSECFFAGKGTTLVLALNDIPQYTERRLSTDSIRSTNSTQSNNSDIQQHLQSMFYLIRHEETLKMAVKLESQRANRTRYLVIASRCCYRPGNNEKRNRVTRHNSARINVSSTTGSRLTATLTTNRQLSVDSNKSLMQQSKHMEESSINRSKCDVIENLCASGDSKKLVNAPTANSTLTFSSPTSSSGQECEGIEESCLLGIDCNERTTVGLVVPILADTTIHLDGDGGFSVSVYGKTHIFKPVSVQAMWSALQTLHKVSQKARENNFYPGGPSHDWLTYYEKRIESDQSCLNEWNAMDSLESRRPPSPDAIRNKPTAKEETESVIKTKLKEIMMSVDLDEVTSKYIRSRLEEHLDMDLGEYKSFIDEEMLIILGQMDAPTEIFEHVYLGSEWNASNLEELQKNGVRHILNVTREIDNFFPGMFDYLNVRVYDDEKTNLLKHWDNTYRYITRAKSEGSKVLVHCKMGVSRSASVVIAYAMKAYNWEFQKALQHVKGRRNCIKPNKNFLNQLETYRGMLDAMKNKEKLQRSKSETNLKSTKDARLLPGSEPTPLIQALNNSKSKCVGDGNEIERAAASINVPSPRDTHKTRSIGSGSGERFIRRRSSSTSPRSIKSHNCSALVIKQQSHSLENLTPERSVADEPKNMRFPGSNGENYSVTQNQVLHIQKHIPQRLQISLAPVTSVRTIVHDLEAYQLQDFRKSTDDRKSLILSFGRTGDDTSKCIEARLSASSKGLSSPVWTSSAKLITQTSNIATNSALIAKEGSKYKRQHSRKTQSWAATSGGITMDAFAHGSNSSIDSVSTHTSAPAETTFEVCVRTRPRPRELPSRHASWGSGDSKCGLPIRNSSWAAYDSNRNNYQYTNSNQTNANAIFEGQIHELNVNNKTASADCRPYQNLPQHHHLGTVKRTKQKLEECSILKKVCQENGVATEEYSMDPTDISYDCVALKRNSNLYRSTSAVTSRTRYTQRCSSEEIMHDDIPISAIHPVRRSDGSRPLNTELFSASVPNSYTMSDIENKNTFSSSGTASDEENVILRAVPAAKEDHHVSGNVKILKKSFEAKAVCGLIAAALPVAPVVAAGSEICNKVIKSHQSLPSSPIAQHVDHPEQQHNEQNISSQHSSKSSFFGDSIGDQANATTKVIKASPMSSGAGDYTDHNVKGLVHKYQTTTESKNQSKCINSSSCVSGVVNTAAFKPRPRSYYESQRSLVGRPHEFNDSRPPPGPIKAVNTISEGIMQQPPSQQRRLQQHGKTHPLARLSLPKQTFNAAAYNTM
uniref:protein-serine/threonine phosphatase n=1 Tax=Glossina brevipalpis TaxID=37001 RepID=A0A1A9X1T2_9MUSC